ncbi:hypothetical protein [Cohnella herbarum]|uniref:Tetratricopeptide repeat protein n=1 Tax=Cohnella herbarum TaxID=2728023 RepID=A0A7Z2VLL2_9BACL|nr:hypothetical protein [Cohnella herbarum]QJD85503.1 hypothetical protein HH215_21505 [Cohnella herbarum]
MSQTQYKQLASYVPGEWMQGSPVEILQGTVFLDPLNERAVFRLKMCNISGKILHSVHLHIGCYDETGEPTPGNSVVYFAFQDMNVSSGSVFGEDQLIALPDVRVRKVVVFFKKALIENDVFHFTEMTTRKVPELKPLSDWKQDWLAELKLRTPENAVFPTTYVPQIFPDQTWACTCGKMNELAEAKCERCARDRREQLELVNPSFLQRSYEARQAEALEQRQLLAVQEKREKRNFRIVITVTFVALGLFVLYESYFKDQWRYEKAEKQYEAGSYEEAKEAFLALGKFRDSSERVKQAEYGMANADLERKDFKKAEIRFGALGNYKDSAELLKATIYGWAQGLQDSGKPYDAMNMFNRIIDYKDSKKLRREARYQYVLDLREAGKFLNALDELRELGAYKDSRDLIKDSKYEYAKDLVKQGHYTSALGLLNEIDGDYASKAALLLECRYRIALSFRSTRAEVIQARDEFIKLGKYKDSARQAERMEEALIWHGKWYRVRYREFIGKRVTHNKTYGPLGTDPLGKGVIIDYFDRKLTSKSTIATLEYTFELSGNKLIADSYGSKERYVLSGNKLIYKTSGYEETFVREDLLDKVKP